MAIRGVWKKALALGAAAMLFFAPPGKCAEAFRFDDLFSRDRAASVQSLMPGGTAVGLAVETAGVTVLDVIRTAEGESPAARAGLRAGDVIRRVDGREVYSARQLQSLLETGAERTLLIARGEEEMEVRLQPGAAADGSYRMGAWVRDGAAGIGTLTFYDPADRDYGALGHAICDGSSMLPIAIRGGELTDASIGGVRPSRPGEPGELLGTLGNRRLGTVTRNTPFGVFGRMETEYVNPLYPEGLDILPMGQVQPGDAVILATVSDEGMQAYDCRIVSVAQQDTHATRSLLLQVTDPDLLSVTGGIAQGMSGSPIIQDGKLVGAVTHVLVNDPTRGYGIFIENMLDAAG